MDKALHACTTENPAGRLIVALDLHDRTSAENLIASLAGEIKFVKVGFELFLSLRPDWIGDMQKRGLSIFFDHKFFDIPRTVEAGVRRVIEMGASCLTVHAETSTMEAALRGRDAAGLPCKILGVTVLTHMDDADLRHMGVENLSVRDLVLMRACQAASVGIDGVIASAQEAKMLSDHQQTKDLLIVTPGVREQGDAKGDQKRVSDVQYAFENGADYIVVGRPIVQAEKPIEVFRHYVARLKNALEMKSVDIH